MVKQEYKTRCNCLL